MIWDHGNGVNGELVNRHRRAITFLHLPFTIYAVAVVILAAPVFGATLAVETPWFSYGTKVIDEYHFELDDRTIGLCKKTDVAPCFPPAEVDPGPHYIHLKIVTRDGPGRVLGFYNLEWPLQIQPGDTWVINPQKALESNRIDAGLSHRGVGYPDRLDQLAGADVCTSESTRKTIPLITTLEKQKKAAFAGQAMRQIGQSWVGLNVARCLPQSLRVTLPLSLSSTTWSWATFHPLLLSVPPGLAWRDVRSALEQRAARLAFFEEAVRVYRTPALHASWLEETKKKPWSLDLSTEAGQRQFLAAQLFPSDDHARWAAQEIRKDSKLTCETPTIERTIRTLARQIPKQETLEMVNALVQRTAKGGSVIACQNVLP